MLYALVGFVGAFIGFVAGVGYTVWDSRNGKLGDGKGAPRGEMVQSSIIPMMAMGGFLASISLDIDLTPFFDALNQYLPIFLALFAVIGGLVAAMGFARYIVNAFISAFNGGKI